MNPAHTLGRKSVSVVKVLYVLAVLIFAIFPVYWMITGAFKTGPEVSAIPPMLWPAHWTLSNFRAAFTAPGIGEALVNSIITGVCATVVALCLGSSAAIGLSRFSFPGKQVILSSVVLAQVVPTTLLLVPLFELWYQIHLYNTLFSLIATYLVFALPLAIWLLTGYFATIPVELEEQALIDGCTRFGATLRVTLPLGLPGLGSTAIYVFLSAWNEYIVALVLTASNSTHTFPVFVASQFGQHSTNWGLIMALTTVELLPAFLMTVMVQRLFVTGMTVGGVKG